MKKIPFLILAWTLLLSACKGKPAEGPSIAVTIEPQRYFAERIAGNNFRIYSVVPPGQSPETYDPTPQQMMRIAQSDAYLRIGTIGFEQVWMDKIRDNNPQLKIFDLSEGINWLRNTDQDAPKHNDSPQGTDAHETDFPQTASSEPHAHEAGHHHHPGGLDPHIWSSVKGADVIARNTLNALVTLDPANETLYRANYDRLRADLQQTGDSIAALLKPLRHRAFIIYHPALTYFADEYGLEQLCIETDGKEPSPAQLKKLMETAKAHDAKVVFIQEEFDRKNAELIAKETGCRLVQINPLAYEWDKEMLRIANALANGKID